MTLKHKNNENYNKNIVMFFFLLNKLKSSPNTHFVSLFQTNIPYFFNTKLNNVKNIILQQKMEVIYNLNNYFYSNHKNANVNSNSNSNSNSNVNASSIANISSTIHSSETNNLLHKLKHINNQKIKRAITWCKKYNIAYSI